MQVSLKFGPESTTDDVLAGVDLSGVSVLVTGASAGLGVETVRALVAHGAAVIAARQGAATTVWASVVAHADEIGGRYAEDCGVSPVSDDHDPSAMHGVRSYAVDPDRAAALWERSETLVAEEFPSIIR